MYRAATLSAADTGSSLWTMNTKALQIQDDWQ